MNQIYLTTIAQGSWRDLSDFGSALASISVECPAERGPAVYHARSLYSMINDTIVYKDSCSRSCKPNRPIAITGPLTGQCGQTGVSYSVLPVPGATSYTWSTSDTTAANVSGLSYLTAVSIDFSNSFDSVQIIVTANNSCGNLGPRVLTVYGAPKKPFPITGNTSACAYGVEYYSTVGSSGATSYNWTVPAGATILGASNGASILVYWGLNGGYVTVSASNNCGTSEVDSMAVTINCRQAKQSIIVSDHLVAYPNPTKGVLNIELLNSTKINHTLTVEDLMGNTLIIENMNEGVTSQTLDLSKFAKGFYFIRISSIEGAEVVKIAVD